MKAIRKRGSKTNLIRQRAGHVCDHMGAISVCLESPTSRSDGAVQRFARNTCDECGKTWRELQIMSTNMSTADYIKHLAVSHSDNSPMVRVMKEQQYARSGERFPDTFIDYEECGVCLKWANQKHQWV